MAQSEPVVHPQAKRTGIGATNISVTYPGGVEALKNVSFKIPPATITALVGINGSGKSTLFKALMGQAPLASGFIEILGQTPRRTISDLKISYVPQAEEVDWNFPVLVEDVVMMGRYGHMGFLRRAKSDDRNAVDEALARVGMEDLRNRQIGELSGGQKKRVFLARALAQQSQIILLDEPFNGVDVNTEMAIIKLLQALRDEGRIMLVSTHNLGSVPQFCDRAILINQTVLASGRTEDVFTPENLQTAFGGVLRRHVLGGDELHDDEDARQVTVLSDDERPLVIYDAEDRSGDPAHQNKGRRWDDKPQAPKARLAKPAKPAKPASRKKHKK